MKTREELIEATYNTIVNTLVGMGMRLPEQQTYLNGGGLADLVMKELSIRLIDLVEKQNGWMYIVRNGVYDSTAESPHINECVNVFLERFTNDGDKAYIVTTLKYVDGGDHSWRTVDDDTEFNERNWTVIGWSRFKPPLPPITEEAK